MKLDKIKNKKAWIRIIFVIIVFLVFFLGSNFGGLFARILFNDNVIAAIFGSLLVLIILGAIFYKQLKADAGDFKTNWKKYMLITLKYWGLGLLVMVVSNIIINICIFNGEIAGNEAANRKLIMGNPVLGFIAAAIFAPIVEELTFRMGFRPLSNRFVVWGIISTLVFAGLHLLTSNGGDRSLLELLRIIPYGSVGFALAYAYHKTNNIFSTITMHMLHNGVSLLLIFLTYFLQKVVK